MENRDGGIGGGRSGCGRKSTGLGVGVAFIQQIEKSIVNKGKDPKVGTSLSFSGVD